MTDDQLLRLILLVGQTNLNNSEPVNGAVNAPTTTMLPSSSGDVEAQLRRLTQHVPPQRRNLVETVWQEEQSLLAMLLLLAATTRMPTRQPLVGPIVTPTSVVMPRGDEQNASSSCRNQERYLPVHEETNRAALQGVQTTATRNLQASSFHEELVALGSKLRAPTKPYVDVMHFPAVSSDGDRFQQARNAAASNGINFTDKLRAILDEENFSEIVSFLPHGRALLVHDKEAFQKQVMPLYFKKSAKWPSFARQLSLYGFRRVHSGPDCGAYYHELFLKSRPDLMRFLKRVGTPMDGHDRRRDRSLRDQREDPDLYSMPFAA